MARRPRGDHPGAWHHVINRGIAKRPLFETRDDARFFLARLVRQVRLGRIEIHAYCLMTTHFHLLVRSPAGQMSEAMRRAQNEHSRRFNRRRRRDGALIRGRFFSRPVRSLDYRHALVRYIDGNPAKAGIVGPDAVYELSSAAAYLGRADPPWLHRKWVESEACQVVGAEAFTPEVYRRAFGSRASAELAEWNELIDARIESTAVTDPLEDLIGKTPQHVRSWMRRKAELADGHRVGLPACGRLALERALDRDLELSGVWMVEDGSRTWRGAKLARYGLLHDLCGCTWAEIARHEDVSESRARGLGSVHRRLSSAETPYAKRVAEVAHAALHGSLVRRRA